MPSVLLRQQQRGDAAIGLGNDPKLLVAVQGVTRQETAAVLNGAQILFGVIGRHIAPIAGLVTLQKLNGIGCRTVEQIERAGCSHDVAECKQATGRLLFIECVVFM